MNSIKTCYYCIFLNFGAKHLILEWNDSDMAMEFILWTVLFRVITHRLELQFIDVKLQISNKTQNDFKLFPSGNL